MELIFSSAKNGVSVWVDDINIIDSFIKFRVRPSCCYRTGGTFETDLTGGLWVCSKCGNSSGVSGFALRGCVMRPEGQKPNRLQDWFRDWFPAEMFPEVEIAIEWSE